MGILHLSSTKGLPYFKAHFDSGSTFLLVCGAEATISIEIMVPSPHLPLARNVSNSRDRMHDIEAPEEKGKMQKIGSQPTKGKSVKPATKVNLELSNWAIWF